MFPKGLLYFLCSLKVFCTSYVPWRSNLSWQPQIRVDSILRWFGIRKMERAMACSRTHHIWCGTVEVDRVMLQTRWSLNKSEDIPQNAIDRLKSRKEARVGTRWKPIFAAKVEGEKMQKGFSVEKWREWAGRAVFEKSEARKRLRAH